MSAHTARNAYTRGKATATSRRPRVVIGGESRDDGLCHPHVVPAKVTSSDPAVRRRGWEQSIVASHKRWAKIKAKRKAARKSRKINRGA